MSASLRNELESGAYQSSVITEEGEEVVGKEGEDIGVGSEAAGPGKDEAKAGTAFPSDDDGVWVSACSHFCAVCEPRMSVS